LLALFHHNIQVKKRNGEESYQALPKPRQTSDQQQRKKKLTCSAKYTLLPHLPQLGVPVPHFRGDPPVGEGIIPPRPVLFTPTLIPVLWDGTPPVSAIPYRVPVAKDDRMGEVGDRDCMNEKEVGEPEDEAELPVPVLLMGRVLEPIKEDISKLLEFVCLRGTVRGIVPIPGRPVFVVAFEYAKEAVAGRDGGASSLVSTGSSSSSCSASTCIASASSGEFGSAYSFPSMIIPFPFPFEFTFPLPLPSNSAVPV